jgi:hypothetical protein
MSEEGMMGGLFTVLAVIAAGAASVYFIASPMGTQLIRKKSVSTILKGVRALQRSSPQAPLHEIYYSLAEERAQQSKWLAEAKYVDVLREAGCFDPRTAPQPDQFAELMASVEEKIQLQASGGVK